MAILGRANNQGYFVVEDFCYAGIPFKSDVPRQINGMTNIKRDLFSPDLLKESGSRQFVAFTSGLNFGGLGDLDKC